jgi:SSS family solute:Na+ symporter
MNLNSLDYLFIGLYFLGLLTFGIIVRRIRNFGDYAVGGRSVTGVMIFASLCATYHGPGYTMGFTGKGSASGWLFFFVALGFTAQTVLSALFIAPRLQGFKDCYTVGDVIGNAYGKSAKVVAGFISTLLCIGFAAIMAKVGGLVLHATTGMPILAGVFLVTGVGVVYDYTGGMKSVIATESMQFTISGCAIPILLWLVVSRSGVSLHEADAKGWAAMHSALAVMTPLQVLGLFLSFFLGETLIPPYANRALASGSPAIARGAFLAGAGYSILWFAMVVGLGVVASVVIPNAKPDDAFLMLATKFLPHGLLGILIIAIASIIMSSQESVLNAGAVSFTRDIWDALRGNSLSDKQRLRLSRLSTLIIGLVAAVLAYFAPSIIDGLLIIYSIWAPSVLPIFLFAILLRNPVRGAGAVAMIVGAGASLIWQFALKEPGQVPALLVGLAANLLTYGGVALLSKRN